jgi:hypothetical protein
MRENCAGEARVPYYEPASKEAVRDGPPAFCHRSRIAWSSGIEDGRRGFAEWRIRPRASDGPYEWRLSYSDRAGADSGRRSINSPQLANQRPNCEVHAHIAPGKLGAATRTGISSAPWGRPMRLNVGPAETSRHEPSSGTCDISLAHNDYKKGGAGW